MNRETTFTSLQYGEDVHLYNRDEAVYKAEEKAMLGLVYILEYIKAIFRTAIKLCFVRWGNGEASFCKRLLCI